MIYFLLFLSIAAYVTVLVGTGELGKNVFQTSFDRMAFQFIRSFFCILIMAVGWHAFFPSPFTLFLSFLMGLSTLVSSASSIACFKYGPVSISILIYSSGCMLISTLSGPVFWNEPVSFLQITGILLCLVSMVLLTERSLVKKASPLWFLFLLLSSIGGGVQGPIQKLLSTSAYAGETMEFVTYSFIFSALAPLLLLFLDYKKTGDTKPTYQLKGRLLITFLVQAALAVFLNVNNLTLVKELPTIIFFPTYSIGGLLITTLVSRFLFKEKMTARQSAGFVTGLAALLLISGVIG